MKFFSFPFGSRALGTVGKLPALAHTALKIGWCASPVKMLIYTA